MSVPRPGIYITPHSWMRVGTRVALYEWESLSGELDIHHRNIEKLMAARLLAPLTYAYMFICPSNVQVLRQAACCSAHDARHDMQAAGT
jgi:hypothetical protein